MCCYCRHERTRRELEAARNEAWLRAVCTPGPKPLGFWQRVQRALLGY
jgi:hypothetical protein